MSNKEVFKLLGDELGAGAFARTHKAQVLDKDLIEEYNTDTVALKIPLDKKKARALRTEVEMYSVLHLRLKKLQAPNLVRYLGFEIFRNQVVMVMEYVSGGSLRDKIKSFGRKKQLPIHEAVRITKGVLQGLAVIHGERVFHRDVKPENILMDGATPKITDLGISRMLDSNELASTTYGTIYYMSPEILSTEGASFTSDIWSTGVTLYEMLAGRLPFGSQVTPLRELIHLICEADPVPICQFRPEIPSTLVDILSQSIEKDSDKRFGNAQEMYDALERFEHGKDEEVEREYKSIQQIMTAPETTGIAETKLRDLVKKYSQNATAYQYLGEFYNRCLRHEDAIGVFQRGLKCDPDNALLHWDLALACHRVGRRTEAITNLKRALALGLDTSLCRYAKTLLKALGGQ